jgi:PTS system galactitol-specific IIC component
MPSNPPPENHRSELLTVPSAFALTTSQRTESLITAPLGDAGTPATALLALPGEILGTTGVYLSLAVWVLLIFVIWFALRAWPKRMYIIAGASEETAREAAQLRHSGEGGGLLPTKLGEPLEIEEPAE